MTHVIVYHCISMTRSIVSEDLQTKQLIQTTLQKQGYIHNRRTKSPLTCFGTPWVPSSGIFHFVSSRAFEMIRCMQHSYTFAHVLAFSITAQEKPPNKC